MKSANETSIPNNKYFFFQCMLTISTQPINWKKRLQNWALKCFISGFTRKAKKDLWL